MAHHLKTRIAISVSLLTLSLMILLSWLALAYFEREFKTAAHNHIADSLSITADGLSSRVHHALHALELTRDTLSPEIINDPGKLQVALDAFRTELLIFDNGIVVFSPDGKLIAVNPYQEDVVGMDFSFRDYIKLTVLNKQPFISPPFRSKQRHHHPIVMMTEPILNEKNEIVAILGGSMDLYGNNFLQKLVDRKIGDNGYYMMLDQRETMVIHPDHREILASASKFFPREQTNDFLVHNRGNITNLTIDGQEMIGAFQHVSPLNWILVAVTPLSENYIPIQRARIYFFLAISILSLLTILAVRKLTSRLTAPLLELADKVRLQADDSNTSLSLKTERYQELGDLASSIQALMTDVSAKRKDLKDQLAFLQNLIDTIPGPIFYKDSEYRYMGCNTAFENYIGISREELIGKSVFDIAPPDLANVYNQADADLWEQGGEQVYEANVKYVDGSLHDVIYYKKIFNDEKGVPAGLIGTFLDITERKKAEEDLQKALAEAQLSKEQVDNILRCTADGLIVTDRRNRITHINQIAEGILGVSAADVCGQAFTKLFVNQQLRKQAKAFLNEADQEAQQFDFKLNLSGSQFPLIIEARSSMLSTEDGKRSGIITLLRDVTRERELDQIKNEFISTAAHEMRTPMSVIMGYIEMLLDKSSFGEFDKEKQQEFLGEAYRKSEALVQIIDDLFDISRIEAGLPLPIDREECDLNEIIKEVVSHYRKHTSKHQFKLTLTDEAKVHVDRNKITQVIENLVSNSVKYSRNGGEIEVESSWNENLLQIDIRDQGQGMSEEEVKRVFDKFYRVDSSDTAISGLGLGMSIVKTIVEGHDGTIRVDSTEGEGTCVTLTLPHENS